MPDSIGRRPTSPVAVAVRPSASSGSTSNNTPHWCVTQQAWKSNTICSP